jgi:uncharacterized protein
MDLSILSPELLAYAVAVTLIAGFVKGTVGFAMPLVMLSGMSILIDPVIAIAGLILPTFASNFLLILRVGRTEALAAAWEFRRYIIAACAMIALTTQLLASISPGAIYLVVGIPVLAMSTIQLAGVRFALRPERRPWSDIAVGAVAGGIGGISASWGPPTVIYLLALDIGKLRQLSVQGVVYFLGSTMLFAGHLASGILNGRTLPLSLLLLLPAGIGMWLGFRLGDRLEPRRFRQATLVVLILAGAHLVRRGLLA